LVGFQVLRNLLENGSAYLVGKTNGSHWYCYLWETNTLSPETRQVEFELDGNDYTLEILMSHLDPANSLIWSKKYGYDVNGKALASKKIEGLYEDLAVIDDFMFDPWGYSCNGITKSGHYFTIHVTPESHCSYASFETNIPPSETLTYNMLVYEVVKIFQPRKFTVTLFAEKNIGEDLELFHERLQECFWGGSIQGFRRADRIHYEFEHYDLGYYDYMPGIHKEE
jgi:S-adenosylmethionine decarboxylase